MLISARLPGTNRAAPTPCTARAAISCWTLRDKAQAIDASGEDEHPQQEDAPAPQAITQRPAHQEQRRQHQRVRLDHPLRLIDRSAQFTLDRRQGDVDDGAIDKGEARSHDRDGQHPALLYRIASDLRRAVAR